MKNALFAALLLASLTALLSACGQRGPLYLPAAAPSSIDAPRAH